MSGGLHNPASIAVKDEGVSQGQAITFNFTGDVTASVAGGVATINVSTAASVAAVEAAGLTFDENVGINLDPALSADGKWSPIVQIAGIAGATLAFGDLVYLDGVSGNNKWELADADAAATAGGVLLGICVVAANEDAATTILLWGTVRADAAFPTLTIGGSVHVGLTAGDVQVAAPSATGDIVRIVGYGNTANELYFCPDNTYVEIT